MRLRVRDRSCSGCHCHREPECDYAITYWNGRRVFRVCRTPESSSWRQSSLLVDGLSMTPHSIANV